jgi:hypothetical protein
MNARPRIAGPATKLIRRIPFTVTAAALLALVVLPTGCTSARYRTAPKQTEPLVLVNLPSTLPPIEALLHTVIIYRGPGSWKREAYWDEYVVTVANRGNAMVTIDSASLTDFHDQVSAAGTDPWELESVSRSLAEKGFGFVSDSAVQIGGGVAAMAIGGSVGAMAFSGTIISTASGAAVGGLILLPAFIGGTVYSNIHSRHAIEREFERRRLVLPATLVPGQLVQGSLFFRISPGPKRLTLRCHIDGEPREVVIDLTPLAGLHLKTAAPPPARAPATRSTN